MTATVRRLTLPAKLQMTATLFGDGARGMAFQCYVNKRYGVSMTASREHGGAPFKQVWTADALPDREFDSLGALRAAYNGDQK